MKAWAGSVLLLALFLGACQPGGDASEAVDAAVEVPRLSVDPDWPAPLPQGWVAGVVTGIAVDDNDHIWVLSPPNPLTPDEIEQADGESLTRIPTVVVFDRQGSVVQAWDDPTGELEWPETPHGIFPDEQGYVWIGYRDDHRLVKFTRSGEHVLTIGERDSTGGDEDPERLGAPADVWVDPETNEAYVADGYLNRRVVVYDASTGEYLRHWGAFGRTSSSGDDGMEETDEGRREFSTVHGIVGSHDGLLYVADRGNNRVQVFDPDGQFVDEVEIAAGTEGSGSAFDVALSADQGQTHLYVADGTNQTVWIVRRGDLEVVGQWGTSGEEPGEFLRIHNIDTDSEGNVYTAEVEGERVQRFVHQGGDGNR